MLTRSETRPLELDVTGGTLFGDLTLPAGALGLVAFAHGSGSSRMSPRNRAVAETLIHHRLGTFLVDLLTPDEGERDEITAELRFDIPLLGDRMVNVVDTLVLNEETAPLPIGLFGASTGAAAALIAAADRPEHVRAVVSRGGRPDLAPDALPRVVAKTLLIVGGDDTAVIGMNREALARMRPGVGDLVIVPGATHLFEEPGMLERVAELAAAHFVAHLPRGR
jgi:pimeloyl-ACP methyl ester carboxylesterase